jgi:hypothetical protein
MTPAVVGDLASTFGFSPSERSTRAGFGPRLMVRSFPNPATKRSCSAGSYLLMHEIMRVSPSPVISTKSSKPPSATLTANASTAALCGVS